ncbi:hypothetical protein [Oryza sativa Japonica Group]|uniref:DUF4220 domain-containing protein n=1 Tax=Oryza sativa subsp. japonica TaxID=39947 RepID=Q5ZBC9_ORYSJ|nr:hypothetical protein [Oryza sativa Japonica Group]
MSMSGPREACDVTGLDEFYKRMQARVWRTRGQLIFAAAVVTILVGSGVYSRRHRRHGFARFVFLGASTLYLPVVSYLVSDIGGENCGLPKDVKECKDMSAFFLEAWAILALIFGANSFVIAAADDHGGQNVHRPVAELLVRAIWTSYISVHHFRIIFPLDRVFISMSCGFVLVRIVVKLYAFLKAQRSFAHGRNPRLIAGYMDQLKQDIMSSSSSSHHAQAVNVALPLLVMGEDEQQVEEGPHGYRFRDRKGNESLVTIGKVQIMSSTDGVLSSWPPLKDLCLSFSLFKLLRRRFARCVVVEEGSEIGPNMVCTLFDSDTEPERIVSIVADELSFACDFYHSSLPVSCSVFCTGWANVIRSILPSDNLCVDMRDKMGQTSLMDTNMNIGPIVRIKQLLGLPVQTKQVKIPTEVKAAIINTLKSQNWRPTDCITSLQQSHIGKSFSWACKGDGTSDVILVWHIATCIFEIRHSTEPLIADSISNKITATYLSQYCAYLLSSASELLPDDKAWSKKSYESVKKIVDPIFSGRNDKPLEYEYILLLLVEKSRSDMILNKGLTLGKQLVEGIEDEEMGWTVLAGFWSEMILYIAPSDNIDAHRRAIARGECSYSIPTTTPKKIDVRFIVVVISYATLLVIDVRFIVLAVFPFIALAFIAALCVALIRAEADNGGEPGASSSSASSAAATDREGNKNTTTTAAEEAEQLTAIATLGALVLMLTRLSWLYDAGVAPGVAPASPFTSIDRSSTVITVDTIKSNRNGLVVFLGAGAVAGFGYLAASMDEHGVSRCAMTSVSCVVSGLLVYYAVFMLRQWPRPPSLVWRRPSRPATQVLGGCSTASSGCAAGTNIPGCSPASA